MKGIYVLLICALCCLGCLACEATTHSKTDWPTLRLLPYPQVVEHVDGALELGPAACVTDNKPSETETTAAESLGYYISAYN